MRWANLSTPNFHSRTCEVTPNLWETQFYKFKSEFFYTRHGTELIPIFQHCSVVSTLDWVQHRLLLLVMHKSKCEFCYLKNLCLCFQFSPGASQRKRKEYKPTLNSSKRMHPTTANLPIAHTVRVWLPQIGNCYITNWYSLSYRHKLLYVEKKSVFNASF